MSDKVWAVIWVLARIFVGVIFAYAGFSKLSEPVENFRGILSQYPLIPYQAITAVSLVAPWFELISGVFLILGYAPRPTLYVVIILLLVFLANLGWIEFVADSGLKSCGCFGETGPQVSPRQMLYLDLISLLIVCRLARFTKFPFSLDALLRRK